MNAERFLLDVNILVALFDPVHPHHQVVARWFSKPGLQWGVCAFSEAGFLRVTTRPRSGRTLEQAAAIVKTFNNDPNFSYWPILSSWNSMAGYFKGCLHGSQQVTDAYLLGLAIEAGGVLVTLDKGIRYLAGPKHSKHLLVLE
jgi:toxin-antitoxin system PIN domain toxin